MTDPDVSILIVNWNTRDLVVGCLDALPDAVAGPLSCETIVVDNGSVDGSSEALSARTDITLIPNDANLGFAAAVNQAYRRSRGEMVLLLNSDVTLRPGALTLMVQFVRSNPEAAGVGPIYVNPDGTPQPFHFRLPTFAVLVLNGSSLLRRVIPGSKRLLRNYRMLDDDFSAPQLVPQPSASCLLLRRSFLPSEHVFDERYPVFFNDVQLARLLAENHRTLWVIPTATAVHDAHSSARLLGSSTGRRIYIGSLITMLKDTESPVKVMLYRALVLGQHLASAPFQRNGRMSIADLLGALRGDPGPLPRQPAS